jgi:hypothetical protein
MRTIGLRLVLLGLLPLSACTTGIPASADAALPILFTEDASRDPGADFTILTEMDRGLGTDSPDGESDQQLDALLDHMVTRCSRVQMWGCVSRGQLLDWNIPHL